MKSYSYINSLKSDLHPSEDLVLQEFYEQRKKRSANSTKRHSLLQKNASYFSNPNYLNQSVGLCKTPENNQKPALFTSNKSNVEHIGSVQQNQKKLNKEIFTNVKDQIKDRNRSVTQLEIMNKYRNFDKQNPIPTCRFGFQEPNSKKTKDPILSTSKHSERRASLIELQNSFKSLISPDSTHLRNQISKSIPPEQKIDDLSNFREKFKRYMPNGKFIEEDERVLEKSNTSEGFNGNQNIKIVNKVRNNSSKQKIKQDFIKIKQIVDQNHEEEQPLIVLAQNRQIKGSRSSENPKTESQARVSQPDDFGLMHLNSPAEVIQNLKSSNFYLQSPNFKFAQTDLHEEKPQTQPLQKSRNQKETSKEKKDSKIFQLKNSRQSIQDIPLKRQYNTFVRDNKNDSFEKTQKLQKRQQQNSRQAELEAQVTELRKKVEQLQKINKKQSKFIDSVQTMRKVIENTETPCNLKQLWRWLKGLPSKI